MTVLYWSKVRPPQISVQYIVDYFMPYNHNATRISESGTFFFQVTLQTGKVVSDASVSDNGKFLLKVEKRTIDLVEYMEADYLLVASGSSKQVEIFCSGLKYQRQEFVFM